MIKVGRVVDTRDYNGGGKLKILPLDSNGDESTSVIQAVPASPNIGDGHGFLSVPGPGSLVIYIEAPAIKLNKVRVPVKYIWLGAIALPVLQTLGQASMSHDKNDSDETNNTQKDYLNRGPSESKHIYDAGVPEGQSIYADNGLPQKDMWKHKKGHKIVMSHKITDKGTHDTGILAQSAAGKHIHINDGHPGAGAHDRIVISDEKVSNEGGPNKFEIISGGEEKDIARLRTERDQVHISHKGNQLHEIAKGVGSQRRDNRGSGDIVDKAYKGQHIVEAEKGVRRTAMKGGIIEVAKDGTIEYRAENGDIIAESSNQITLVCGGSTVTLTPTVVSINSPSILLNGIDFNTHIHGEQQPLLGVTTPPFAGTVQSRGEDPDTGRTFFDGTSTPFVSRRAPTANEVSTAAGVGGTTSASRTIKLFVISIGQSNNGLLDEPGELTPEDVSDPSIFELSQGIQANRYKHYVAPAGERHVFTHPAQDDLGGICMRLPAAKEIRRLYASIVPEVTVYCGAQDGAALSAGLDQWEPTGKLTQKAIDYCNTFMLQNPDYTPVIWCSLGASDALYNMAPNDFSGALAGLASQLRSSIDGAENAFWVQCDMPQTLVDGIDTATSGNGTAILNMQQSAPDFIPNAGTATMYDFPVWDLRHIGRDDLRTLGRRVAASMSPWLASVALDNT